MNFKKIGLGLITSTTVLVGMGLASSPAHALSFGDTLSFFGRGQLLNENVAIGGNSTLDFKGALMNEEDTSAIFGGNNDTIGSPFQLSFADLTLKKTSATTWVLVDNDSDPLDGVFTSFISGLSDSRVFNLKTFNFTKDTSSGEFVAALQGFFEPPGSPGIGQLSTQAKFSLSGDSFSGSITVVPTPALLPGLIGMGVAALRKKRKDEEFNATPDAAEECA